MRGLLTPDTAFRAGQNIRKLVKDGFVIKKPTKIHSRSRARVAAEAKAKGRHSGYGTPPPPLGGPAPARPPPVGAAPSLPTACHELLCETGHVKLA